MVKLMNIFKKHSSTTTEAFSMPTRPIAQDIVFSRSYDRHYGAYTSAGAPLHDGWKGGLRQGKEANK